MALVLLLCEYNLLPCKKAQIFAPIVIPFVNGSYAAFDEFIRILKQDVYEDLIKNSTFLLFIRAIYVRFLGRGAVRTLANLAIMRKYVVFATVFVVRQITANIFSLGNSIQRAYHFKTHFFKKYVYTINHKRIALNYLYFTVFSGMSGALLATYIRMELAYPGSHFFKGDSTRYLQVITSHGLVMVFYVVVPLIFGMFANFLIPYHVGSKDVAFPRLNSIGF